MSLMPDPRYDRPMPQTPEPFVWGAGGTRMTAEDIELQRRLAAQQMAAGSDFSPVGHFTQGLARVGNSLVGALQMRKADKAASANQDAEGAILQALMTGGELEGGADPIAAALANPGTRDIGLAVYQARQPKAQAPTEFERALIASGVQPGTPEWVDAHRKKVENAIDPIVNANIGGRDFFGPRSLLLGNMGGGGPASVASPGVQPPAVLPPDFNFDEGGPASASATFP